MQSDDVSDCSKEAKAVEEEGCIPPTPNQEGTPSLMSEVQASMAWQFQRWIDFFCSLESVKQHCKECILASSSSPVSTISRMAFFVR